jgi:hypothetical protein
MGFTEDIAKLSERVRQKVNYVVGEEATKMALIVPFLSALGYDIHDPTEVIPEYVADFATKGKKPFEKVDYAIAINGTIVMIVEAKACGQKPEAHDGQLRKYFNSLIATKVAIVTNGVEYRFFTDLRHPNIMDEEPFFSFNIFEYDLKDIENLKFFHCDNFDGAAINSHAEEMVYVKGMTQLVGSILRSPSEEFIRFLIAELGKLAPSYKIEKPIKTKLLNKFEPIVKKSIQSSLLELMTRSLSQEMAQNIEFSNTNTPLEVEEEEEEQESEESQVVTTAEELEALEKIKAIAATSKTYHLEVKPRDTVSYFGVNLGKTTWWFLRLYLNQKKKSFISRLSLDEVKVLAPDFEVQEVSASLGDAASKVNISSVNDLDKLAPLILRCYEKEAAKH